MKATVWKRLTAPIFEPYARYQYADILHAIHLDIAIILAREDNIMGGFPHGEWTTMTVIINLGLLQFQGAIYTKAKERVLGTLLGIVAAIAIIGFI